jgi:tetratricopeptide (TPR) repeat protein
MRHEGPPVHALTPPLQSFDAVDAFISAGDHPAALELIRAVWPSVASTNGARLRTAIKDIPEHLWNEDAWIIAALGASFRSVDSPDPAAALPHFELAELLIAAGVSPGTQLPAIQLHHAASLRTLGRLVTARDKAESARDLLQSGLERTLPLRLALQATASLQLGLLDLHLGNMTGAIVQLRLASSLSENGMPATDVAECLGGMAFAAYSLGEFDQAEKLI